MWPVIIATPQVVNSYLFDFDPYKREGVIMLSLLSGLFTALIGLGASYLIAYIITQFKKSTKVNGPLLFFLLTSLFTIFLILKYGRLINF